MLLHPLGQSMPALAARIRQASGVLDGLPASEQLEVACQPLVGILAAIQPRFEKSQQDRLTFDVLCSDVEGWLQKEIQSLRFART